MDTYKTDSSITTETTSNTLKRIKMKKVNLVIIALAILLGNLRAQTSTKNYVVSETVLESGKTTESEINSLLYTQKQVETSYYDEFGRLVQTNMYKAAADGSKDIITAEAYDAFGRPVKKFIPYSYSSNKAFDTGFASSTRYTADYNTTDDDYPYAQTRYQIPPLNRITTQGSAGYAWRIGGGHEVGMTYGLNSATEVRNYTVSASGELNLSASYYTANTVYKTASEDEDDRKTEEFRDFMGRVVLKRSWDGSTKFSTYYVYDNRGLLCYVIPPKVTADDGSISATERDQLCYQYFYDQRKRLSKKRTPGTSGFLYLIYDNKNRLVLEQDAKLRASSGTSYRYTLYDSSDRPIEEGICTETATLESLTTSVEASNNYVPSTKAANTNYYYDSYTTPSTWRYFYSQVYADHAQTNNVKGLATGVKTKVLETSTWLYTVNYYDKYGRLLQQYQSNPDGGYNRTTTAYNFTNQPLKQQVYHKKTSSSTAITTEEQYTYDHMNRLLTTTHRYNGGTTVTIAQNTYDEIGRLRKKELHNGYQDMDYTYNVRGWLTQINDPTAAVTNEKKFAMKLYYDADMTSTLSGGAQFNGNVNGLFWRKADGTRKGYNFSYDGLNRLTNADYGTYSGSWSNTGAFDMSISLYDLNGNIKNLIRKNSSGTNRESLAYTYTGNQLASVSGYYGGNSIPTKTFSYDSNGNATTDNLRETTVQYFDELDLPKKYTKEAEYAQYEYDASGTKWSKTVVKSGTSTMEYYGSFIYQDATLDRVLTSEGYYIPEEGIVPAEYCYFLKDHLGNTRMVVSYSPSGSTPAVEQETEYYPFGSMFTENSLDKNKYLYNGKELQNEFFENYDYGARFYDPELGRWHSIDNLAEHPNQIFRSPYQYAWNNPVNLNDPDGNCPWCIIGAVIGAAVDYGAQVAVNYATGNENPWTDVNGASIVTSAIAGAATGGLASVARTGAITTTRAVVGSMAINAGESMSKQMATDGSVNPTQVVVDVAVGQVADGIPTKNIVPTKQLDSQLDRVVRVAGETPRASRAQAVSTAQGKVNAANNVNQAFSATQTKVTETIIGATGSAVVNSSGGSSTPTPVVAPQSIPIDNTRVNIPIIIPELK